MKNGRVDRVGMIEFIDKIVIEGSVLRSDLSEHHLPLPYSEQLLSIMTILRRMPE